MSEPALTDWLMQANTPSIRYQTLRFLLDLPESDPAVLQAREAMRSEGPIPVILERQAATGAWKGEHSFYTPKYTSTHWSMLLLVELDADPADPLLQRGAAYMLDAKEQHRLRWLDSDTPGLSCLWGNMLRYIAYNGFHRDPRLEKVIGSLTREPQTGWRCPYNSGEPCAWGAARSLWGLAGLPAAMRTPAVEAAIQSICSLLLDEHDLMKADYPKRSKGKTSPLWRHLSFPLFYQADRLFVLRLLAELDLLDLPSAQPALDWLETARLSNGQWSGASPFRQRTWTSLGDEQETRRWVSLQAARVLKAARRL